MMGLVPVCTWNVFRLYVECVQFVRGMCFVPFVYETRVGRTVCVLAGTLTRRSPWLGYLRCKV